MRLVNYEPHIHEDPSFPIIFHLDYLHRNANFLTHWHENIEILHILKGSISVLTDANRVTAKKGDIVIINSNHIHSIQSLEDVSEYYCLIIDKKLCEEFDLYTEEIIFQVLIDDKKASRKFKEITNEMISKKELYKSAVKSAIMNLMIYIYRNYTISESLLSKKSGNIKIEMIKKSMKYIQDNYNKAISTSDIAKELGLSSPYFCRTFKELTGYTVIFYINLLRCTNAKRLFQTGKYLVSEVALLCGFDNLSYFSRTYKKHIGCLPSSNKNDDLTQASSQQKKDGIPLLFFTDFSS